MKDKLIPAVALATLASICTPKEYHLNCRNKVGDVLIDMDGKGVSAELNLGTSDKDGSAEPQLPHSDSNIPADEYISFNHIEDKNLGPEYDKFCIPDYDEEEVVSAPQNHSAIAYKIFSEYLKGYSGGEAIFRFGSDDKECIEFIRVKALLLEDGAVQLNHTDWSATINCDGLIGGSMPRVLEESLNYKIVQDTFMDEDGSTKPGDSFYTERGPLKLLIVSSAGNKASDKRDLW